MYAIRKLLTLTLMVTLAAALPTLAAEPAADATAAKPAGDAWSNIKSFSIEKKNQAVAYGRELMSDTDARIAELEAKAAKASTEAKVKYEKEIEQLKATHKKAAAKLDSMEQAGGGAWGEAKQGFADAYRDLQGAYKKAAAKFK
jgi:predicted phage tail protein